MLCDNMECSVLLCVEPIFLTQPENNNVFTFIMKGLNKMTLLYDLNLVDVLGLIVSGSSCHVCGVPCTPGI